MNSLAEEGQIVLKKEYASFAITPDIESGITSSKLSTASVHFLLHCSDSVDSQVFIAKSQMPVKGSSLFQSVCLIPFFF